IALAPAARQALPWPLAQEALCFLGSPMVALGLGALLTIPLLRRRPGSAEGLIGEALRLGGSILCITAAGGAFGEVIARSGLVGAITAQAPGLAALGLLFPYLIAALLKTALGSATVSITITATLLGPASDPGSLLCALGLGSAALAPWCVMAMGAGAIMITHANGSFFWMVAGLCHLTPRLCYLSQSLLTVVSSVAALAAVLLGAALSGAA
ncbi:MAG: hypothetical protein K6A65_08235, partial [Succinivibrionaceae bacterium]|nr:hypothetical protein [Succinivibrionaceae bacterium]